MTADPYFLEQSYTGSCACLSLHGDLDITNLLVAIFLFSDQRLK